VLLIACPHCGPRPEIEFRCGGEAHIARPPEPERLDDDTWAEHLFARTNPRGVHAERWNHAHGCQRWFNALRDTASDRILATYRAGEPRPDLAATA
jgi:sarcosine oxidase subunit delta